MGNFLTIAAAGESIRRLLNLRFEEEEPVPGQNTTAVLVRTSDFGDETTGAVISEPALSIFLYRVEPSRTMRAAWSAVGTHSGRSHLPLDLHFLLTPWAGNANHEYRILGKAMQALEDTPILSGPLFDGLAGSSPHEAVQVCLEELTTEDVMRTFDSLPIDYKLSVPYVARVIRIDGQTDFRDRPATTLVLGQKPGVEVEELGEGP